MKTSMIMAMLKSKNIHKKDISHKDDAVADDWNIDSDAYDNDKSKIANNQCATKKLKGGFSFH